MLAAPPVSPGGRTAGPRNDYDDLVDQGDSPFDLPSKLLGNSSVMQVLGLDADFAQALIRGERAASPEFQSGVSRMLIIHHQHAVK